MTTVGNVNLLVKNGRLCLCLNCVLNAVVICHLISVSNSWTKQVQLSFVDYKKIPCRIVDFRHQAPRFQVLVLQTNKVKDIRPTEE
jgi:hypothetical protein